MKMINEKIEQAVEAGLNSVAFAYQHKAMASKSYFDAFMVLVSEILSDLANGHLNNVLTPKQISEFGGKFVGPFEKILDRKMPEHAVELNPVVCRELVPILTRLNASILESETNMKTEVM